MTAKIDIENSIAVTSLFGYWPKFCDAKFQCLSYVKKTADSKYIGIRLSYLDYDLKKGAEVEFLFDKVSDIDISGIYDENVLDGLLFSEKFSAPNSKYIVHIESCTGISGSFSCKNVIVKEVKELTDVFVFE